LFFISQVLSEQESLFTDQSFYFLTFTGSDSRKRNTTLKISVKTSDQNTRQRIVQVFTLSLTAARKGFRFQNEVLLLKAMTELNDKIVYQIPVQFLKVTD
jgi:hypothetical protein